MVRTARAWRAVIPALLVAASCALKTKPVPPADGTAPRRAADARRGPPVDAGQRPPDEADGRSPDGVADAEYLERDALIELVLRRNPALEVTRQAWEAARTRSRQVDSLEDPMLGYSFAPLSIGSSRVRYGETVDLSQRIPWPGLLRLRGESALRGAEARGHDLETRRLDLALAAALLFDDYYLVERALAINAHHVHLLEEFQRVATGQYATGLLGQQDPLQAEVELAHLEHERAELETQRRVAVARLNALLHRAPRTPLPPPPPVLTTLDVRAGARADAALGERLQERALAARPEIAAAAAEIAARRADVEIAGLAGYPAFDLTASYNSMWGDAAHRWMTGLRLNVPLWRDRIDAERGEARARLLEAEAMKRALEDEVSSSLRQNLDLLLESAHVVEIYRGRLLPAAGDLVQAARAGVDSGRGSFLALIEAEKNLRDVELGMEDALANLDRRTAQLARDLGCLPNELGAVVLASPAEDRRGENPREEER